MQKVVCNLLYRPTVSIIRIQNREIVHHHLGYFENLEDAENAIDLYSTSLKGLPHGVRYYGTYSMDTELIPETSGQNYFSSLIDFANTNLLVGEYRHNIGEEEFNALINHIQQGNSDILSK